MTQAKKTNTNAEEQKAFSAPSISPPKGGGAIRGMGEKFAANPVTGTGAMTVPIATSPGRSKFGPQLSLSYDSGAGNGPFGFGWSLSLPTITRKTDKGLPKYRDAEESDPYILSGAEDLVPILLPDGTRFEDNATAPGYIIHRYRPRVEGLFARIERWTKAATGEIHWRSISRDNVTTYYGRTEQSRISDPNDTGRVFSWLICESHDDKGNAMVYEYAAENDANIDLDQASERNRVRIANRYLKRIKYGNRVSHLIQPDLSTTQWLFQVVFDYDESHFEDLPLDPIRPEAEQHRYVRASASAGSPWAVRPDPFSSHRAGFEVRTHRRCRRVLMFHCFPELGSEPYLVRATELDYADLDYTQPSTIEAELAHQGSTRFASFICSITESGFVRDDSRPPAKINGVIYQTHLKKSLPPLEFEYSKAQIQDEIRDLDPGSLENLPAGLDNGYQWVDLNGEGISGILTEQAGAWYYKPNLGNGLLGPLRQVAHQPSLAALRSGKQQLLDLGGDGQLDLVELGGSTPGFYERTADEDWTPFKTFAALPNIPWDDPNLRFVDLNGDGHADVLITEDNVFTWYPSLAEEGFGPASMVQQPLDEEHGPRLVSADSTQSIYLADMCGDGLTDLVRIKNGEVCYWPNLGYGRFGAKVAMNNAPWFDSLDQFDLKRLRLADLDGSGTTDLIYLGREGVDLYFNQSGNTWSEPRHPNGFPSIDNLSSVMTADLLGNGTACLVWSSPLTGDAQRPLRYLDLMGGQKPHLLVKTSNNLGVEIHVEYAPSTKYYLADKLAGKPWITRLPFPVHTVERVKTYDRISGNRFVTRYAYHHGYFDGAEREFRGFGLVEQWDTEEFAALTVDGALPTANIEAASHVPPLYTKTWYHTGFYLEREAVSLQFAAEYYREPGLTDAEFQALLLPDTVLPTALTLEEERQACRALKGSMLRQEIYALDGTDKERHPYKVTEQSFIIQRLQPKAALKHAVFLTHIRESLNYQYERNPADPRLGHKLALELDNYGNVCKEASIGYGRRQSDPALPLQTDRDKQTKTLITYTENSFTNPIDGNHDYRAPMPAEARTYELTGYTPTGAAGRFQNSDFVQPNPSDPATLIHIFHSEVAYEEPPTSGRQRRLIEQIRTLYRKNDLTGLLPLGTLESQALTGEGYKLAFTPGLLTSVFQRNSQPLLPNPASLLGGQAGDQGGYMDLDGNGQWWIPTGRAFHSLDPGHTAAQELTHARSHFFLPCRYRDPFHTNATSTEHFVVYDAYDLLMVETRDALGNRITAGERDSAGLITTPGNDYRLLQPKLMSDFNRNRTAFAFDALGMVVGKAVMGKPGENLGDSLVGFEANLTEAVTLNHLADPLADPQAILGRATTRLVYDLFAYRRTKDGANPRPAVIHTVARETHGADLGQAEQTRIQHNLAYSDGFGREIQKKILAESGPVPRRDGAGRIILNADGQPEMTPNDVSPRWVGSGWLVQNNKGKPVRQYEPFFTDIHRFEFDVRIGVSPILYYDPIGRVIATLHPNHAWEKVIFTPWQKETWDLNDTVLVSDPKTDPNVGDFFRRLPEASYLPTWHARRQGGALGLQEQRAAAKAAVHASTPAIFYFDSLGRSFLAIAHNRYERDGSVIEERYHTRYELDIEGNQRAVHDAIEQAGDALGRLVMRYDYDLLGDCIHQASMEAGQRWLLNDVAGKPIRAWDSRGHTLRTEYDALRRPINVRLQENGGQEKLVGRTIHGEAQGEALNHRGQIYQQFDQAGIITNTAFDFKDNLIESRRELAADYQNALDWSASPNPALQPESLTSHSEYDALNRTITLRAPDNSVIRHTYNEANLLESLEVNLRGEVANGQPVWTPFVTDLDYDAKGQRRSINYGNNVQTTYDYDHFTYRLTRLRTRRGMEPLQDLGYTYDPIGNLTYIRDDAQQTFYFRNRRVEPSADYTYDAIYRLIEATGREHLGQASGAPIPQSYNDVPRINIPHPGDGNAMGTYIERYLYDAVGNFRQMQHRGSDPVHPGWTRGYIYDESSQLEPSKRSNRLTSTACGSIPEIYSASGDGYDAHGNMLHMPQLQAMQWDFMDRLRMTRRQAVNTEDAEGIQRQGERTWYVYDSTGQRVRKVTELATGGIKDERIYLGGFEVYRKNGTSPVVRETLHIMDDKQRIAMVETRTDRPSIERLIRYQFGNHLGSASLELDGQAQIISYEEYTPYGSTSYQAVSGQTETPKRYRYTGKERDEETGLNYYGGRYSMPWVGRWLSCDPALLIDRNAQPRSSREEREPDAEREGPEGEEENSQPGILKPGDPAFGRQSGPMQFNSYCYALANPLVYSDPDGRTPTVVGHVYVIRGTLGGQSVTYVGSTAQELMARVGSGHRWNSLVTSQSTTVTTYEVTADLNVAASGRGTYMSARGEALRSAEQRIMQQIRRGESVALNEIRAATPENAATWRARHAVSLGRARLTLRGGVRVGCFAGFALLDAFLMYRDQKLSQYGYAPYVLEDEGGQFTLQEERAHWFAHHYRWKVYRSGPRAGQRVEVTEEEFNDWRREGELLWGTTDFWGDFVPGLLRPRLPVVHIRGYERQPEVI